MKSKIIEKIRAQGYSVAEAEKALAVVTGAILDVAKAEKSARVPGFGTFHIKHKAEKKGRNPRTGETVTIAARDAFTFKEAKDLVL